jgi:hypothetical protein
MATKFISSDTRPQNVRECPWIAITALINFDSPIDRPQNVRDAVDMLYAT